MNIYFLCKRYYTNKDLINDRFGRLYHLPKQLAESGNIVVVNAFDYRNSKEEALTDGGALFRTIPLNLATLLQAIWRIYCQARDMKPDVIIASGDIYIGCIGLLLARRLRVKFVYDVYDYYPAFQINQKPGFKSLFNLTVSQADLVSCASHSLKSLIWGRLNENAVLVENGVDRTLFAVGDSCAARRNLKLPVDGALVGYFGSITPARGPLLIEACRQLRESNCKVFIVLAGRIDQVDINEPWIYYYGEVPQALVPQLISACDVVALPYASDQFNSMSGACKIAEYLACGKPVVATNVSGHAEIFKATPLSLCDPTPVGLALAIKLQLEQPQVAVYPMDLDWQSIGQKLYQELTKLVL